MSPEEIIALLKQKQISPETTNLIKLLVASDGATDALINTLLYFLDQRGIISRQEFIDFLTVEVAKIEAGKSDENYVLQFLKMKVDGLSIDPPMPN